MNLIPGQKELLRETLKFKFENILDIGLGNGYASDFFLKNNKKVTATGYNVESYKPPKKLMKNIKIYEKINAEDLSIFKNNSFDAIWCSHVLEHTRNHGKVLDEIYRILKPNGLLFIMIPPYKTRIVGGHVNIGRNIGTLMYNLILSGFDVKKGEFIKYKYNICGFVRKSNLNNLPKNLFYDKGDIEKLKKFFPKKMNSHAFEGNIYSYNWKWKKNIGIKFKLYGIKEKNRIKIENFLLRTIQKF